jgi:hypothetical protein
MTEQVLTESELNQKVKEWSTFQSKLDPDRRSMFNQLVQDVQKYKPALQGLDGEMDETILLALIVELKRELEDVRDQLEIERIQHCSGKQLSLAEATY